MKSVSLIKALALTILGGAALGAHAETYPARPITLIVPYPAGGTTDIAARTIAQAMGPFLKQSIVVDNRAGAGGNIGMGVVKRAHPDGYTIGMGTIGTQTINQYLYSDMPFDPAKDFAPLAMVFTTPNVIAVSATSDMKTVQDLFAKAKANKNKPLTYGSPGIGSSVHLTGAYLEQAAGIQMLHVPFKGVSGSMPALIGGQIDILLDNLPSTLSQLKDGTRVRALAVTSARRSPSLPDVPTVAEAGLKDFDVTAWFALYAPAGTPPEVQATLIDAAKKALATPEVKAQLASVGASGGTLTGADLSAFEVQERQRWSKLIKERNITTN
ncbi:Bug family tripartite tricarboxylate transporter substrate binding protein [Achromobacter aloeverae]|uniref:Tripartite tricarboxylate transporter substrate binding protein n=1 Tax=Achromobacter aloeverae TaxID=1750518 RepID=A0A4Q1HM68_9BURK|nr:tripartite tricarboxylate transporter substrate binding protein [Achromobacter aloeverae]RXN91577.1 tripartite tricarboxylate transporter substrate binding protein [Achromobacter aloeverae]